MAPYRFGLKAGSFTDDAFKVIGYGIEEALSACYKLTVNATAAQGDIGYSDLIGKPATLTLAGDDYSVTHKGRIEAFRRHPDSAREFGREAFLYELTIRPRLHALSLSSRNRVFLDKDVRQIADEVLSGAGFTATDYRFDLAGTFPKREFTVQYNESDLAFLERLLADEGIFYFFDHTGWVETICFGNQPSAIANVPGLAPVEYRPGDGLAREYRDLIVELTLYHQLGTGRVVEQDYNEATPETRIAGLGTGRGDLEVREFAPHARDHGEAARLAGLRAEMHEAGKESVSGSGNCRALRSGFRFRIAGQAPAGSAGDLALVSVSHRGDPREGFSADNAEMIHRTTFTCIPATRVFRPRPTAPKPRVSGLLLAKVDGMAGSYAFLDDEGRYRAKLPFDDSDRGDGQASLPIRLSQPYAGPNYGVHFPLHIGNDLVLGFLDGDIDRPIALGAIPNPSQASPVTGRNKSESVIRTASGHRLRMDDLIGKTIIDLLTAGGHLFAMNDDMAAKGIALATEGEHLIHLDDTGTRILVRSKYGHEVLMDDGGKTIVVKTGGGHRLEMEDSGKTITLADSSGKTRVVMDGSQGNVSVTAAADISIEAGGCLSLSAGKDFSLRAGDASTLESGKTTTLASGKDLLASAAEGFRVQAKQGSLEMDKELLSKAAKILSEAGNSFQAKAGKLTLEADGKLVLKGSQISQN